MPPSWREIGELGEEKGVVRRSFRSQRPTIKKRSYPYIRWGCDENNGDILDLYDASASLVSVSPAAHFLSCDCSLKLV